MQHYGGKELARSFRTVRGNTIQIAEEIPEVAELDCNPIVVSATGVLVLDVKCRLARTARR